MSYHSRLSIALAEQGVRWHPAEKVDGLYSYDVHVDACCSRCGSAGHTTMFAAGPYDPMLCDDCRKELAHVQRDHAR